MASFLLTIHSYNVYIVIAVALITGVWGLILYFKKNEDTRYWNKALIATVVLGVLQALLGIGMVALGLKPGTGTGDYYLHYVYGALVALGIPVGLTYSTNGKNKRRDILIFSVIALLISVLGVRAYMTGSPK